MAVRWSCSAIQPRSRTATARSSCFGHPGPAFPFVERAFADAAYAAERVAQATRIAIEIVHKPRDQVGFAVHPRRWVVERCFAWLGRNRRLAKDFEATIASATTFLYAASVLLLIRRLARSA
jgi:putative transposase